MKKIIIGLVAIAVAVGVYMIFFQTNNEVTFLSKHEEAAKLENKQKGDLAQLLEKESNLYDQIIAKGKEDNSQASPLIKEAQATIKEIRSLIEGRQEVMTESYDLIKEAKKSLRRIRDDKLEKQAENIDSLYEKRYKLSTEAMDLYTKLLKEEEQLYANLSNSNTDLKGISNQVSTLSEISEKLNKVNKSFNDLTDQYNEAKMAFYKKVTS
ncbi:MAG: YkyA family protein [Bacillaceae bacterium]